MITEILSESEMTAISEVSLSSDESSAIEEHLEFCAPSIQEDSQDFDFDNFFMSEQPTFIN